MSQEVPAKQDPEKKSEKVVKSKIKPYAEVITEEAVSDEGLFHVHRVGDKLYYEIPSSLLERDMLLISRIAKTANGLGYGGEKFNTQMVRQANLEPIAAALTKKNPVDIFRRNLQKAYIERLEFLLTNEPEPVPARYRAFIERTEVDVSQSDIRSFVRGELRGIQKRIVSIIGQVKDQPTRFHLEDIADRITLVLRPPSSAEKR